MSPNIHNYRKYIRVELLREGIYNVYFADNNVFLGKFLCGPDGFYTFHQADYYDYTGDWTDYALIGIGLCLLDINIEINKKLEEELNKP